MYKFISLRYTPYDIGFDEYDFIDDGDSWEDDSWEEEEEEEEEG